MCDWIVFKIISTRNPLKYNDINRLKVKEGKILDKVHINTRQSRVQRKVY